MSESRPATGPAAGTSQRSRAFQGAPGGADRRKRDIPVAVERRGLAIVPASNRATAIERPAPPPPVRKRRIAPRWSLSVADMAAEAVLVLLCGLAAFLFRFDFAIPAENLSHVPVGLAAWLLTKTAVFRVMGLECRSWRLLSFGEIYRTVWANAGGSLLASILILAAVPEGFPRSIYFLDFLFCSFATTGARVALRMAAIHLRRAKSEDIKRVIIYGAGETGALLVEELCVNASLPYQVCGFVDDDRSKRGSVVHGVRVLGLGDDLATLVQTRKVDLVLVAIPSASAADTTAIIARCRQAAVPIKTVPPMHQILDGAQLSGTLRDFSMEDLLGRSAVRLDERRIRTKLGGHVVLVTGAAGSIGSELCRQIARFSPQAIVGLDIAETGLFELDLEMKRLYPGVAFYPEVGSIQNRARLDEIFTRHQPSAVYHAAAYKHVPMMEKDVFEAVENNILGTWNVAVAAARHGVADFVQISSDKAVRPTSMMGASKRVTELLIRALQGSGPNYVSVRFGNVLGSNGSVVPLFRGQIARGGPVTVTHPEMRRFFMTIAEAVQLVLQASVMGHGGEIFVLDMGKPVRIVDLATTLIMLSGLRPEKDIEIRFSGVRPGEKLFEELSCLNESTVPTFHEKIRIFQGNGDLSGRHRVRRDLPPALPGARLLPVDGPDARRRA